MNEHDKAEVVRRMVAAYNSADHQGDLSDDMIMGHRSGVRNVAVRIGLHVEFCDALEEAENMSKAQHFKSVWSEAAPAAGDLSELLESGWDTVSIVHSQDRYITYLKRVADVEMKT